MLEISDISDKSKVKPGTHFLKVTISDSIDQVEFKVMLLVFSPPS